MVSTVSVRKEAIIDLVRVRDEFDAIIDSLELLGDEEFMTSYARAKEQIKNKDFVIN